MLLICIAVLTLTGALVMLWQEEQSHSDEKPATEDTSPLSRDAAVADHDSPAADPSEETRLRRLVDDPAGEARGAAREGAHFISGSVVDRKTGEPVRAFGLELYSKRNETGRSRKVLYREFEDEEGRFRIPVDQAGSYALCVYSSAHENELGIVAVAHEGNGGGDLVIELDPAQSLNGRVNDLATGAGISGATVFAFGSGLMDIAEGRPSRACHAKTDGEGRFTLGGLDDEWTTICAIHPDYTAAHGEAAPGSDDLVISLGKGHRIFGTVLSDSGDPCPDVIVSAGVVTGNDEDGYGFDLPVVTGPDGTYRLPRIRPGRIELDARPRREGIEGTIDFTPEGKKVTLVDRDVEVNFGPLPSHATWRGSIVDAKGLPPVRARIACRTIEITGTKPLGWKSTPGGPAFYSDDEGRFEARKLLPGRYRITVSFAPHHRQRISCGEVVLAGPGLTEKDIRMPGGAVRGTVLDEGTRSAPESRFLSVFALTRVDSSQRRQASINGEGEFILRGLPPGFYTLSADLRFEGRKSRPVEVEVAEGELVDGVELMVPSREAAGGFVKVTFVDFVDQEGAFTLLRFEHGDRSNNRVISLGISSKEGACSWQGEEPFREGAWTLVVEVVGLGRVAKSIEIVKGQTVAIDVFRSDFDDAVATVALEGRVSWIGGEPVADARIRLKSDRHLGHEREISLESVTNAEGMYIVNDVIPGSWQVAVELPSGGKKCLPDLEVPADAASPHRHDIVLPCGSVRGKLVDGLTGLPVDAETAPWTALLVDSEMKRRESMSSWRPSSRRLSELFVRHPDASSGSSFVVAGVPDGDFILHVEAEGYFVFDSDSFSIAVGSDVDLGEIRLKPSGLLLVEALDEQGSCLEYFEVEFPDLHPDPASRRLPDGRRKFWRLPPGEHRIYIKAEGCKGIASKVNLRVGVMDELRVTLTPLEPGSGK